ncbi:MAG TPA: hypothetical protein VLJ38_09725, partial [Polyangiaceae bacterium]|nr:hypothetical protein [Polyangiaceae bacterium]
MQTSWRGRIAFASALGWLLGCSSSNGTPPANDYALEAGGTGSGATGGTTSTGGSGGTGANGGTTTIMLGSGGASMAGSGGSSSEDPCKSKDCGVGQRCQADGGVASCVDKTCDEVACKDTELCQSAEGGGHICVDKCTSDAACDVALHCDTSTGECLPDDCTPDTRTCGTDDTIRVCSSNGAPGAAIRCGSGGYFMSQCTADAAGSGACTCEDDWDCPPFMTCEAGACVGTGV